VNIAEFFEQSLINTAFRYVTWLTQLKFPSHWDRYHVEKIQDTQPCKFFKVSDALTRTYAIITTATTLVSWTLFGSKISTH